jgi:hypothetical protein
VISTRKTINSWKRDWGRLQNVEKYPMLMN